MTREKWLEHMAEVGFETTNIETLGPERTARAREHALACVTCAKRRRTKRANTNRREREETLRSMGLVKVKGAVSGRTYWE